MTFESAVINAGSGWACTYDATNHRVVCTAVTMAAGSDAAFTITVTPDLAVDVIGEGVVSADESASDSNPVNDADSAVTTVEGSTATTAPDG